MSKMKRQFLGMNPLTRLFVVLALAMSFAIVPVALWAVTDTFDTPTNFGTTGTYPDCLNFHGNSSSTANALVVTLPNGFTPAYVRFHNNATATDQTQDFFEWYEYMGTTTGLGHLNGSPHVASSNYAVTFSSTDNTITIPAAMQTNSGAYVGRACR